MASPPIGIHDKCDTVFHSRCLFQATILCCVISSSFAQCLDDLHEPILVYDFAESLASQFRIFPIEHSSSLMTLYSTISPFGQTLFFKLSLTAHNPWSAAEALSISLVDRAFGVDTTATNFM